MVPKQYAKSMIKGTFGLVGSIYSEGRQEVLRKPKNQYECKQVVYQEKTIKMMWQNLRDVPSDHGILKEMFQMPKNCIKCDIPIKQRGA